MQITRHRGQTGTGFIQPQLIDDPATARSIDAIYARLTALQTQVNAAVASLKSTSEIAKNNTRGLAQPHGILRFDVISRLEKLSNTVRVYCRECQFQNGNLNIGAERLAYEFEAAGGGGGNTYSTTQTTEFNIEGIGWPVL